MDNPFSFSLRLQAVAQDLEQALDGCLSDDPLAGEILRPARLLAAMRAAVLGGGKRLRPFLLVEAARLFGADGPGVMRSAAALECLHCYSLVHDDLPAMDDDDIRRGLPTVHRAFDEATAILAGDALLTLAFDLLADEMTDPDPLVRARLVQLLARAAGVGGMVGGQMLDILAEGETLDAEDIIRLQSMKTGALLRAAVEMGACLGRAGEEARLALQAYGRALGSAFQIADDLLDAEGSAEMTGKATGKDAARGKGTLVDLWGVEAARARLQALMQEAQDALSLFGPEADVLRDAARFVAERQN